MNVAEGVAAHSRQEQNATRNVYKTEIEHVKGTDGSGHLHGVMALPYPRVSSAPLIRFRGVRYYPRDRLFASPLHGVGHLELSTL
jgi:hypothetical protein